MKNAEHNPKKPYAATDISQDGLCVLCWNLIARSLAQHLDANYEENPYKDIPLTATHPIIADVSEDIYINVLNAISETQDEPTSAINLSEFMRVTVGACNEILSHPEVSWFELTDDDSEVGDEEFPEN